MIEIRRAALEDAAAMLEVINPIIRAGGTTAHEDEISLEEQEAFLRGLGPQAVCHVAIADGELIGFQDIGPHPQLPPEVADIATFVKIGAKTKGVGRALSEATFDAAAALGYASINATIRADNFQGLGFYTAMGFRDFAVARAKPLKSGKKVDRISKRRPL